MYVMIIFYFLETPLTCDEFDAMVAWLKHNVTPLSKVSEFVEKTAVKRAQMIRSGQLEKTPITDMYPRLFDTPGMVSMLWRVKCNKLLILIIWNILSLQSVSLLPVEYNKYMLYILQVIMKLIN